MRSSTEYEELHRLVVLPRGEPAGDNGHKEGEDRDIPETSDETEWTGSIPGDAPEAPVIDWDALEWEGSEVVGWVYVPGVDISYPVCDGDSNEKYLHMTAQGSYLYAGSIFMDEANETLADKNVILYGHNMRNGSMFHRLNNFRDQSVYDACPYIWLLTKGENRLYRIISVHYSAADTSDASYRIFNAADTQEEFNAWLQAENARTVIASPIPAEHGDRVLTLSTCHGDASSRQVVQGVLIAKSKGDNV